MFLATARTRAAQTRACFRSLRLGMMAADRRGVTALEYGIVATFFCVGLVTIFANFGTAVTGMFNTIITKLQ